MLLRHLYKKITGKEDKTKAFAKEIMGTIAPQSMHMQGLNLSGHPTTEIQSTQTIQDEVPRLDNENQKPEKLDSWKEKIQNKDQ